MKGKRINNINRILIFRNKDIGNSVMALPLIENLKKNFPDCKVDVVVDEISSVIFESFPLVDQLILFDKKKTDLKGFFKLASMLRSKHYDVSIHSKTGGKNEFLAWFAGIPVRISFKMKGSFQFANILLDKPDAHVHVRDANLQLLIPIIPQPSPFNPRLYPSLEWRSRVQEFLAGNSIRPHQFLIVHPGGKTIGKDRWNTSFYEKMINNILESFSIPILIIGLKDELIHLKEKLKDRPGCHFLDGKPLQFIKELIGMAGAFLGNDSGPYHLAEAWDIPAVVIFPDNAVNFSKWRPLNSKTIHYFDSHINNHDVITAILNYFGEQFHEC